MILFAFNLGLKDYHLVWILVNGILTALMCAFWSTFMFLFDKIWKKEKGEPNLGFEEKYNFGIFSFDNFWYFLKSPWSFTQVIFSCIMGGAFGALSADFFWESAHPIFNFWAYTVISHLHMPILLNNLLSQVVEIDHYTTTRGSSFYHGRYQHLTLIYLITLIVWVAWPYSVSTILVLWWIAFVLPIGFLYGIIPPLIPFVMYFIGELNVHFLGASESGSMIKTLIWFCAWSAIAFLVSLIFLWNYSAALIASGIVAFLLSNELLYKIPFMQ